jgi:hypothetical protein
LQTTGVSQGRLPDGGTNIVSFPTTPTPEESNYLPLQNVVINEVLTHTDLPLEDAIELQNVSGASVNIGGWFISNSQRELKKFQVPAGTTLAAGGFKVFYEGDFNPGGSGVSPSFTLNAARGDAVYLSEADASGNLTGNRAQVVFGAAENAVSFGRFVNSQTNVDFVAMAQRTFGADNPTTVTQFRTGHRTREQRAKDRADRDQRNQLPTGRRRWNESRRERGRRVHRTGEHHRRGVPLFDPARPTNSWKLGGGVSFVFSNVTIPANGYLIVANFDPANARRWPASAPATATAAPWLVRSVADSTTPAKRSNSPSPTRHNSRHIPTPDSCPTCSLIAWCIRTSRRGRAQRLAAARPCNASRRATTATSR